MDFDSYTVVLLVTGSKPPELTEAERVRLQDAHLAHLAALHEDGVLVGAGPLTDVDGHFRGLSILRCGVEEALQLKGSDPAVQAGIFGLVALPWMLPAGAIHFTPTHFPRSIAEATG